MDFKRQLFQAIAAHFDKVLTPEVAASIVKTFANSQEGAVVAFEPSRPTREQIERFERLALQRPQVVIPTRHYFAPGMYAREAFIPKGVCATGAVHKTEHLAMFVGDITVWTDGGMKRLSGHHTLVSKPGTKRVAYAHQDTWCTCFYATETTDIRELERELVEEPERLQCNALPAPERAYALEEE